MLDLDPPTNKFSELCGLKIMKPYNISPSLMEGYQNQTVRTRTAVK